jgi:hypothetical protein
MRDKSLYPMGDRQCGRGAVMRGVLSDARVLTLPRAKSCGGCTACCSVMPVDDPALKKAAYRDCPLLRPHFASQGPGCSIYGKHPRACAVWSCGWLLSPDLPLQLRPDRCGVVMDPIVDLIRVDGAEHPAAQFWAIPGREDAYLDETVAGAISGALEQVPFVLWRQRGADGKQWARAITKDGQGDIHVGPLAPSTAALGTEIERFARADELLRQK